MKDTTRADVLRSMTEDLALLTAGTTASQHIRELTRKGTPLATKAIDKLTEYAAGFPAGGTGAGGATNITHDFTEPCRRCNALGHDPDCPDCKGTGKTTETMTVPQHPDRTGEAVANPHQDFPPPATLDRHLAAAARHLHEAATIAADATIATNPTSKTRDDTDDWCASCARITDHQGRPFTVPSRVANGSVSRTPTGTANGRAGSPLCATCYGFVLGEKIWPPKALIELKRDGKRWTAEKVNQALGRGLAV